MGALPSGMDRLEEILVRAGGRRLAVFLDYDGTLTPIVERPEAANLSDSMREVLGRLAALCTVAVISGRDLDDLRGRVALEPLYYAGSHGLDLAGPAGWRHEDERARRFLPSLDRAQAALQRRLGDVPGCQVERKRFAIAVHYRRAAPRVVPSIETVVDAVLAQHPDLRKTGGKKIFELRPGLELGKGDAIFVVLEALGLRRDAVMPLYIGDDLTDEDAFEAIAADGAGLIVRGGEHRTRAHYLLEDPQQVESFLGGLIDHLEREH